MRSPYKFSPYQQLKNKWTDNHEKLQRDLWSKHADALQWIQHSSKQAMAGSLASLIMTVNPLVTSSFAQMIPNIPKIEKKSVRTSSQLITDLATKLPATVSPLTAEQETVIGQTLTDYFQIPVTAILQNKRLNRSYGIIGAEQHLMRYPGDIMETHFDTAEEHTYFSSGMAPGRGAYGYFAQSQEQLTALDKAREKYYIAVQTFLAPGWQEDTTGYYNFFRYRKMLIVNPENGKAMVVVIGDAGPAEWTGKHLGGSPEVMSYLDRHDGAQKGPVLYFFIDDPEGKIPLGPISIPQPNDTSLL